ncbi:hypothetical protein GY21_13565 [Cryobacterium roopkundense]|uniref:4Fe-4S Wbl-type domain-containing protein n=1 Tax=Cryobacterium roopkundense TaxID=1001240 RepID=A0A099J2U2_9MICO|nr:hypothetical protein [Cryobacterium roopkundense]KGJ72729.1 hypothetical protein GY21_13565 [Cryobacterium roopkundense]MBB5641783.1 hypothetical protein [Cryobacterium roopkundense]
MSRATDAYTRLQEAMTTTDPECQRDERFIRDDQAPGELAPLCRACPLYDLCAEYAELARPIGGIWAGKRYNRSTTTKAKS